MYTYYNIIYIYIHDYSCIYNLMYLVEFGCVFSNGEMHLFFTALMPSFFKQTHRDGFCVTFNGFLCKAMENGDL